MKTFSNRYRGKRFKILQILSEMHVDTYFHVWVFKSRQSDLSDEAKICAVILTFWLRLLASYWRMIRGTKITKQSLHIMTKSCSKYSKCWPHSLCIWQRKASSKIGSELTVSQSTAPKPSGVFVDFQQMRVVRIPKSNPRIVESISRSFPGCSTPLRSFTSPAPQITTFKCAWRHRPTASSWVMRR